MEQIVECIDFIWRVVLIAWLTTLTNRMAKMDANLDRLEKKKERMNNDH